MSGWSVPYLETAVRLGADVLALQETKLTAVTATGAKKSAKKLGCTLHPGSGGAFRRHSVHGLSAGVGLLAAEGMAVKPVLPEGAPWRRLHAAARVHAVLIPARPGLPLGLLLVSVYAPLPADPGRAAFEQAFLSMAQTWDMQRPTLLLGDFNGAVDRGREFLSGEGHVCPLLCRLCGPRGIFTDLFRAHNPDVTDAWTYQKVAKGAMQASRIDLILGNRAAALLVEKVWVVDEIRDGFHSPVMAQLRLQSGAIPWQVPRRQLPQVLRQDSKTLLVSDEWMEFLKGWDASPEAQALERAQALGSVPEISRGLDAALEGAVSHTGGWTTRARTQRWAFDSEELRQARAASSHLARADKHLRRLQGGTGVGGWPTPLIRELTWLEKRGIIKADRPEAGHMAVVVARLLQAEQGRLRSLVQGMRKERVAKAKAQIPMLWDTAPGVLYRWLRDDAPAWGSAPVMGADGQQCLSPEAVDREFQSFWVDEVWRKSEGEDGDALWRVFLSSEFGSCIPSATWPIEKWTPERVQSALKAMREGAAPGLRGIPIAVWKSMPLAVKVAMADLLNRVEGGAGWPESVLEAYVAMIPKEGGTTNRDARPITVLDVLYRVWAKGNAMTWKETVQGKLLGPWAKGFRAQEGGAPPGPDTPGHHPIPAASGGGAMARQL
jgi:exonuclease III